MSGVMKWIHFLASSSLRCQRTLCYQHRWSRHGSGEEPGANYKQATVNTNESQRIRSLLSSDSFGSNIKMSESQWSCPTKCTVKTLDRQFGSPANRRGLPATLLWEASTRRPSAMSLRSFSTPPSPYHFLISKEGVDNLCWGEHLSTSLHQLSLLRRKLIQAGQEQNGFTSMLHITMKN